MCPSGTEDGFYDGLACGNTSPHTAGRNPSPSGTRWGRRGVSPEVMSGGYCGGVPPLPIPNREVKPACADGTAMQCGRVGGRLLSHTGEPRRLVSGALLFSFWRFYLYGLIQTNKLGCYFCLMVLQSDFIYSFLGIAGADTLDTF